MLININNSVAPATFITKNSIKSSESAILVCLDDTKAELAAKQAQFFLPEYDVITIPAWDCIPYDRISPSNDIISKRLKALSSIINSKNKSKLVITSVNAYTQKLPPVDAIQSATKILNLGDVINHNEFSRFLVDNGYINTGTASDNGEFALRGSIIDIVPMGSETGFRLDFFGDNLESIRQFDLITQITTPNSKLDSLEIIPASEALFREENIENFKTNYREAFAVTSDDSLFEAISEGRKYAGFEHWLPLFYNGMASITDYIDAPVYFSPFVEQSIAERTEQIKDYFESRSFDAETASKGMFESKYNPLPADELYNLTSHCEEQSDEAIQKSSQEQRSLDCFANARNDELKTAPDYFNLSKAKGVHAFELFYSDIAQDLKTKNSIIACNSNGTKERISTLLNQFDIAHTNIEDINDTSKLKRKDGKVGLGIFPLEHGFSSNDIFIVSEKDLIGEKASRITTKKRNNRKFIQEAGSLTPNELVVHKDHGIGRFISLETMEVGGLTHDFIYLEYYGGDKFYVPVENIDTIKRFGSEDGVELDRLGSANWQNRTSKLKKRIKQIADALLIIAAKRATRTAPVFNPEPELYNQFIEKFPYSETEDQLNAAEDIIDDLTQGKPMDRLICGDVGFGKTEVAMRGAAAIVFASNKAQVCLIAPTTLLARQHFLNFKERFDGLGIKIGVLSRLVTAKELKATKEAITRGEVDIVIGTHALLAKDVEFKNLGLVIIDEEQRFGVKQKERLKEFRAECHVLAMSATPIPRTLQLSLAGIRELSLLATAPVDRLPIRTFVMPFDKLIIKEALMREYYRGGKSFYVAPRISDLDDIETFLKEELPELKFARAHGQMGSTELDDIMNKFHDGGYDILLSTTIIESGIDIPSANTIIIHKADMYGLAQLYQIRGRVGRSKTRAFAYLTLPTRKKITENALKRLEVMQKMDTLGAGFTLASHDMDIRGFGNLLGDEQSGNVKEVGIELYQQMLREAIQNIQLNKEEQSNDHDYVPDINIGASVMIPQDFIEDLTLRLSLYRKIANLETIEEIENMRIELVDRFGSLPAEVNYLLKTIEIKRECYKHNIDKVTLSEKGILIRFHEDTPKDPVKIMQLAGGNDNFKLKIHPDQKVFVEYTAKSLNTDERVNYLNEVIKEL